MKSKTWKGGGEMPMGKGTYGNKVGRPSKSDKMKKVTKKKTMKKKK